MTLSILPSADDTRLLFVRHGETVSNVEGRYMGHLDTPLTESGVAQAEAVAARLADAGVEAIYASDLGRAAKTARMISEACGVEAALDARLRERHAGVFQGLLVEEARARSPEYFAESADPTEETVISGGESATQVRARLVPFLGEVCVGYPGETVVLVSHGGVIRTVLWAILGCSYAAAAHARVDNTSLTILRAVKSRWSLQSWNDTSHLSVGGAPKVAEGR